VDAAGNTGSLRFIFDFKQSWALPLQVAVIRYSLLKIQKSSGVAIAKWYIEVAE
jgi:hypothetical protein